MGHCRRWLALTIQSASSIGERHCSTARCRLTMAIRRSTVPCACSPERSLCAASSASARLRASPDVGTICTECTCDWRETRSGVQPTTAAHVNLARWLGRAGQRATCGRRPAAAQAPDLHASENVHTPLIPPTHHRIVVRLRWFGEGDSCHPTGGRGREKLVKRDAYRRDSSIRWHALLSQQRAWLLPLDDPVTQSPAGHRVARQKFPAPGDMYYQKKRSPPCRVKRTGSTCSGS